MNSTQRRTDYRYEQLRQVSRRAPKSAEILLFGAFLDSSTSSTCRWMSAAVSSCMQTITDHLMAMFVCTRALVWKGTSRGSHSAQSTLNQWSSSHEGCASVRELSSVRAATRSAMSVLRRPDSNLRSLSLSMRPTAGRSPARTV